MTLLVPAESVILVTYIHNIVYDMTLSTEYDKKAFRVNFTKTSTLQGPI